MSKARWWAAFLGLAIVEIILLVKLLIGQATIPITIALLFTIVVVAIMLTLDSTISIFGLPDIIILLTQLFLSLPLLLKNGISPCSFQSSSFHFKVSNPQPLSLHIPTTSEVFNPSKGINDVNDTTTRA